MRRTPPALVPDVRSVNTTRTRKGDVICGWAAVAEHPELLTKEPGPLAQATKLASAYGFEVCGRG
jgi:hypothetical protein